MELVFSIIRDFVLTMLSVATIAFAIIAFVNKRLVQAVLAFVQMIICFSVMLLLYKPIYVGVLYIIVYIGAVAVLFLFVLMLVNLREQTIQTLKTAQSLNKVSTTWILTLLFVVGLNINFLLDSSICDTLTREYNTWSSFSIVDHKLNGLLNNTDSLPESQLYLTFIKETYTQSPESIIWLLMNLIDIKSLDLTIAENFMQNLWVLINTMGFTSVQDIVAHMMISIKSNLNTDLIYQYNALENSTVIVSPLFLNENATLLYGSGSLLLLALVGSVYITKENAS